MFGHSQRPCIVILMCICGLEERCGAVLCESNYVTEAKAEIRYSPTQGRPLVVEYLISALVNSQNWNNVGGDKIRQTGTHSSPRSAEMSTENTLSACSKSCRQSGMPWYHPSCCCSATTLTLNQRLVHPYPDWTCMFLSSSLADGKWLGSLAPSCWMATCSRSRKEAPGP